MSTAKRDDIKKALDTLAEAATSLASHGAGGYTTDTSALDIVFLRSLFALREALKYNDCDLYDPRGHIYEGLLDQEL